MNFSTANEDAKGVEDDVRHNTSTEDNTGKDIGYRSLRDENSEKTTCRTGCDGRNSVHETDDDEGNDDLINVRLPSGVILLESNNDREILRRNGSRSTAADPEKPAENLKVDERAILNCWNLTLASHDGPGFDVPDRTAATATLPSLPSKRAIQIENEYRWQPNHMEDPSSASEDSETDFLKNWQPKPLALPPWAVDPIEMGFILDRANNDIADIENGEKRIKRL